MVASESLFGVQLRRWIVLSYVVLAVSVGVPMWQFTTSIYRAPLKYDAMDLYDKSLRDLLDIRVPVYLNVGNEFPDLVVATQYLVDQDLEERGVKGWSIEVREGAGPDNYYNVGFRLDEEDVYSISELSRDVLISYTLELLSLGRIPELVAAVLVDHLFEQEISLVKELINSPESAQSNKAVAYSPNYHLTFSLLHGGGDAVSWEISEALKSHFTALRSSLARVTNFTVDSQVLYYSQLGCEPKSVHYDVEADEVEELEDGTFQRKSITKYKWVLDHGDLSTFVNSAEWSLTSIHAYPTLHFILYVPADDQSPLEIIDSSTNSFIIPQWGGVQIYNAPSQGIHFSSSDLLPILETFSSQLLTLLGVPALPRSPSIRFDFAARLSTVRALIAASSTLGSLHRLSQSLPNIAIPHPVLHSVNAALADIDESLTCLRNADWDNAVRLAGEALKNSESAFFDKEMVGQAFFPEEHKLAIYMPLLGPMCIVTTMGAMRCLREYRKAKSQA